MLAEYFLGRNPDVAKEFCHQKDPGRLFPPFERCTHRLFVSLGFLGKTEQHRCLRIGIFS